MFTAAPESLNSLSYSFTPCSCNFSPCQLWKPDFTSTLNRNTISRPQRRKTAPQRTQATTRITYIPHPLVRASRIEPVFSTCGDLRLFEGRPTMLIFHACLNLDHAAILQQSRLRHEMCRLSLPVLSVHARKDRSSALLPVP